MIRNIFQIIFSVYLIVRADDNTSGAGKLILHFFGSPTCGECLEIKEAILYPAAKKHAGKIDLRTYDVDSDS